MNFCLSIASAIFAVSATLAAADQPSRTAHTNYVLRCAGCHGMTGLGTDAGGIPAFPDSVGHIAGTDMGRTYMMHVPGVVGASLDNREIAEVMNYILDTWAEGADHFSEAEVSRRRSVEVPDVVAYRREVVAELEGMGVVIADYPWP